MYEIEIRVTQEQYSYDLPDEMSAGLIETIIRLPPTTSLVEAQQLAIEIVNHNASSVENGTVEVTKNHVMISSEEHDDSIEILITET